MTNTSAEFLKYAYALGAAQAMADAEKEAGFKDMLASVTNAGRNAGRGVVRGAERVGGGVARGAEIVGKKTIQAGNAVRKGARNVTQDPRVWNFAHHMSQGAPGASPTGIAIRAGAYGLGQAIPKIQRYSTNAGSIVDTSGLADRAISAFQHFT